MDLNLDILLAQSAEHLTVKRYAVGSEHRWGLPGGVLTIQKG